MNESWLMPSKNQKTRVYDKASPPKKGHAVSKWEIVALVLVVLVGIWAVYSYVLAPPSSPSSTLSNSVSTTVSQAGLAPDFTLPVVGPNGLTGQTLTLSVFRGKVVFLEFMEPWCPHCQNMASVLDGLYTQYGKGNVVFISVAGPWNGATASDAAGFISRFGTNWSYVYDSSGTIFNEYGVSATPTFFILNQDGTVSSTFNGETPSNTLASAIASAGGV